MARIRLSCFLLLHLVLFPWMQWQALATSDSVWTLDEQAIENSDEKGEEILLPTRMHSNLRQLQDADNTTIITTESDSLLTLWSTKNRTGCPRGFGVIYRPTHWCSKNFTCGRARTSFNFSSCGCGCEPSFCKAISYQNTTCPHGFKCETKGCLKNITKYNISDKVCEGTCRLLFWWKRESWPNATTKISYIDGGR